MSQVRLSTTLVTAYNHPWTQFLRHALFVHLLFKVLGLPVYRAFKLGPLVTLKLGWKQFVAVFYKYLRRYVPSVDKMIRNKINEAVTSIQSGIVPSGLEKSYPVLPFEGLCESDLRSELQRYSNMNDLVWKQGKVSGAVYNGNDELLSLITEAYGIFSLSNPLHPDLFQGVRQMEAEVVSMVLRMYNAPTEACGNVTSGGTESLLMALKSCRDMALEAKGITQPEIIVPSTIHAAVDKGAAYFNIKVISIPVDPTTGQVPVSSVKRAISSNTIMIAASAPNFPHGIIDDIPALAAIAKKNGIPFHVDACLGGFLIPFMEGAGYPLASALDFSIDGITSISVDTHKYGLAPKGSSVIMYRSSELRKYQYFVTTEWPGTFALVELILGGVYASPSISGSRPGALIAGCWTAMMYMGLEGYIEATRQIISSTRKVIEAINDIPELKIIGDPLLSVFAFVSISSSVPIYGIAQILSEQNYHLNILQSPPAIHMAMTLPAVVGAETLIQDIQNAVEELKNDPTKGRGEVSAIYGTVASVPDRSILKEVSAGFLDALTMMNTE